MAIRYAVPPISFEIGDIKKIEFVLSPRKTIVIDFENITIGVDTHAHYEGEYVITPRVYEQEMETDDKVMDDDVTILPIPITKVSNPQGGNTATIG